MAEFGTRVYSRLNQMNDSLPFALMLATWYDSFCGLVNVTITCKVLVSPERQKKRGV
jgi:hypothetical protein